MRNFTNSENTGGTFLIIVDFSKASYKALNYLIKLAKIVGGSIDVHCIVEPADVVGSDNQIVALRTIESQKTSIENKLNSIIEMIELEGIDVKGSFSFGHLYSELEEQLLSTSPFAVVIGGAESDTIEKATDYLVNKFKGNLLIIGEHSEFMTGTNITVGCNNKTLKTCDLKLASTYSRLTKTPLFLLEVGKSTIDVSDFNSTDQFHEDLEIQYKNDTRPNVVEGLKSHVNSNNVELLCIGRSEVKNSFFSRILKNQNTMTKTVENIKIPLLIMEDK